MVLPLIETHIPIDELKIEEKTEEKIHIQLPREVYKEIVGKLREIRMKFGGVYLESCGC